MKKWYKECPYCWEEIKEVAKKCRFCWEFLEKKEEKAEWNDNDIKDKTKTAGCRKFILILFIGACALIIISAIFDSIWTKNHSNNYTTATKSYTTDKNIPREYSNALGSAESYLRSWDFSKKRLKEQLEYEGYPTNAVNYALENVYADYMKECLWAAQSYLRSSNFSKQRLIEQLRYEWFIDEEISYAINNIDW